MLLDSQPHPCEVITQPGVTETDSGVRVRLGFRGTNQGFEGFYLMGQTREGFAFGVVISKSRVSQYEVHCKQSQQYGFPHS